MKSKALPKITQISLALITSMALAFTATQAFGLVQNLKSGLEPGKTEPAILLRNWGLDNNEDDSHIHARKAWEITKGKKSIVVAVIDTGIDPTHPDLKDNLWHKAGTGEYGYDFVLNKPNPDDRHGHGTHVAGIIGATAKANAGASGVAPNVSIMAVRYYSSSATGAENLSNTIKALNYAIDNGANVINYSGGGAEFSAGEKKAIERAASKGILVVAAAGNEYENTDESGNTYYPAEYGLSNIISVAATNIHNELLPSSNWGFRHVHVAAPGDNIYSTLPHGHYGYLTGTSQATAFVSGLAALILSENPKLKPEEVREIVMDSADKIGSLQNKIASGGRINAYQAVRLALASRQKDSRAKVIATTNPELDSLSAIDKISDRMEKLDRNVAYH